MKNNNDRKSEIRKAINLLGWFVVGTRIKNKEDRAIFKELGEEFHANNKIKEDKILEENHIIF